ncbi:MAG: hypothetical protein WBW74_10655 [Xanthobacteraceae bacterium]
MSWLTTREPAQDDRAAEIFSQVEGEIRDFVRRDAAVSRRRLEDWTDLTPGHIGTLLQRVAGDAVRAIDDSIAELQTLRHQLQHAATRVQGEIGRYASMNDAARASIRTMTESLASWKSGARPREDAERRTG